MELPVFTPAVRAQLELTLKRPAEPSPMHLNIMDENGDLVLFLPAPTEPFVPYAKYGASVRPAPDREQEADNLEENEEPALYRFLVSSTILRRASCVFDKDLDPDGPWSQLQVQADGFRHKYLEGSDPCALNHVLNIIHFQSSKVPRELDVEELAKVAVVVDYFQCHEAVAFISRLWIHDNTKLLERTIGRSLLLWLTVAKVFSRDHILDQIRPIIMRYSVGALGTYDLPIGDVLGQQCLFWLTPAAYVLTSQSRFDRRRPTRKAGRSHRVPVPCKRHSVSWRGLPSTGM